MSIILCFMTATARRPGSEPRRDLYKLGLRFTRDNTSDKLYPNFTDQILLCTPYLPPTYMYIMYLILCKLRILTLAVASCAHFIYEMRFRCGVYLIIMLTRACQRVPYVFFFCKLSPRRALLKVALPGQKECAV